MFTSNIVFIEGFFCCWKECDSFFLNYARKKKKPLLEKKKARLLRCCLDVDIYPLAVIVFLAFVYRLYKIVNLLRMTILSI